MDSKISWEHSVNKQTNKQTNKQINKRILPRILKKRRLTILIGFKGIIIWQWVFQKNQDWSYIYKERNEQWKKRYLSE